MIQANLLFNPNSGRCRSQGITKETLYRILIDQDIEPNIMEVVNEDDAAKAVSNLPENSLLIIAGGDGTIHKALQHSVCLNVDIAVLPLGTANNLAVSAGIPLDINKAIGVIKEGKVKNIDLGSTGNHIFTEAAGAGFHANAFHKYGSRRRKSIKDAIIAFISSMIIWETQRYSLTVDGITHTVEAMQITVANTPVYGRGIKIAPKALIDDGILDIVILQCRNKFELITCFVNIMKGRNPYSSKIIHMTGKEVVITPLTDIQVPVHADSEPNGFAPVTIEVLPGCLRLVAPE
ncbi:MAG: diacylglycerol/lipid kinase family protein [Armatimonadota bacterium]